MCNNSLAQTSGTFLSTMRSLPEHGTSTAHLATDFFEFRMSRPELFARRNGGLVAVGPTETEFAPFNTHGMDAFDPDSPLEGQNIILKRCTGCHSDAGIHSVQSRTRWMKQPPRTEGHQSEPFAWDTDVTIARKAQQPEFKLLQRSWKGSSSNEW